MCVVVHLLDEWETFHRRPMLEALAKNAQGIANVLCVTPPSAPAVRPSQWGQSIRSWQRAMEGIRRVSTNLYVYTPTFWLPALLAGWGRSLRCSSLSPQILRAIRQLGMDEAFRIAWVFRPEQLGLLGLAGERGVVYECHDEYQLDTKTGKPLPHIKEMELALLARTDIVFATTEALCERRSRWHPRVHLVPNGADVTLFSKALDPDTSVAPELRGSKRPIVGYPGRLSDFVDVELIEYIAESQLDRSLVLLGKRGPRVSIERLRRMRNVYILGEQPREKLPSFSKGFDVVILPLLVNEYLHCSMPLTLLEQLAAGRVVVATDLREIRKLGDAVLLARNKDEFVAAIEQALSANNKERIQRGLAIAHAQTWDMVTRKSVDALVATFIRQEAPYRKNPCNGS